MAFVFVVLIFIFAVAELAGDRWVKASSTRSFANNRRCYSAITDLYSATRLTFNCFIRINKEQNR